MIAHNLRSTHNVGSLLRTAEGLGAQKVILSGYTPHQMHDDDRRPPHEADKIGRVINKTALVAEDMVKVERFNAWIQNYKRIVARYEYPPPSKTTWTWYNWPASLSY